MKIPAYNLVCVLLLSFMSVFSGWRHATLTRMKKYYCLCIALLAPLMGFAVVNADSRTDSQTYFNYAGYPVFQSDAQMLRYVEAACKRSAYNINVNVQPGDRLLTLATISEGSDTSCWVILCRMLRSGETPDTIGHN